MPHIMNIFNQKILVLNKNWLPTNIVRTESCMNRIFTESCVPLETEMWTPVSLEDWIELSPELNLPKVRTGRSVIAVPEIIIAKNYSGMPKTRTVPKKPNNSHILKRDRNICQYTGKKMNPDELNVDHVIPKARGGGNSWDNLVTCSKEINSAKGNRSNEEVGLKLIRKPTVPKDATNPIYMLDDAVIKESWKMFLFRKDR